MEKGKEYILPQAKLEAATREQLKGWLEAGNISYATYTTELSRRGKGLSTADSQLGLTRLKDALKGLTSVPEAYNCRSVHKDALGKALSLAQQIHLRNKPLLLVRGSAWYVKLADWLAGKFGYVHLVEQQNAVANKWVEQETLIEGLYAAGTLHERQKRKVADLEAKQQRLEGYRVKVWGKQYQLCRNNYPLSTSKYYSTADNCLRSARKLAADLGIELEIEGR